MTTFLRYLVYKLDQETPGWQEDSVILLDNAKWHSNNQMKQRLSRMNIPVIYSAPYCYSTAPVEMVFAALKFGDLNPLQFPTGKKSLSHIAHIVHNRLASIPRSIDIKYWHHVVYYHFCQLSLERIWEKIEKFVWKQVVTHRLIWFMIINHLNFKYFN